MSQKANDLLLTRVIDAPRALVFQMWTSAQHVAKWWGPMGFTNPVCEWPALPGGKIRVQMKGPDGTLFPMRGEFHEVVEPERIVFSTAVLDNIGETALEVTNTVTFEAEQGRTKLTLHAITVLSSIQGDRMLEGMEEGWMQSLDRLEALLEGKISPPLGVLDRERKAGAEG